MTDGIIQKVFNKYFNEESPNLCDIQQELIEEIQRWDIENRGFYPRHISLKDLIGDNQE